MLRSTRYPRLGSKLGISFRSVNPSSGLFIPTWYGTDTKGFSVGGSNTVVADKATFSSETTAAQTSANLSAATSQISSGGNDTQAYFVGGTNTSDTTVAFGNKITYSNDTTAANTSVQPPVARSDMKAAVYTTAIYSYGGNNPTNSNDKTEAYKTPFSTDTTAAQTSANLSTGRGAGSTLSSDVAAMYFGGLRMVPSAWTKQTLADKMPFATETTANNTSLALPIARSGANYGSLNAVLNTNGYISGEGAATTWTKVTFTTDTSSTMGSGYAAGFTGGAAGMTSRTTAYTLGGYTNTQVNTSYKMPFSTESVTTISAMNKSIAKSQSTGVC